MTQNADLVAFIRRQMAFDETQIRGAMYTARQLGDRVPVEMIERLGELEHDRKLLDTMGDLELRTYGLKFAGRDGYLEEWRP